MAFGRGLVIRWPRRIAVNMKKYLVGLLGLVVGFGVAFYFTSKINREGATVASGQPSGMPGAAMGAGGQQAMMGQVAQTIEKAKSNPKDFDAQVEAAKVFHQIGRVAETVEFLEKAHEIDENRFSDLKAEGFLGQYYFEEKKYPESETWFNRAIKADPKEADLYVALAETYVQREPPAPDKAIEQIQLALKIAPKNGHALRHLIEAYALKKDARAADETLKRLKETDPSNDGISKLESMIADLKAGRPVTVAGH
jgi:tetratricopeptide (TPR) repeat protein